MIGVKGLRRVTALILGLLVVFFIMASASAESAADDYPLETVETPRPTKKPRAAKRPKPTPAPQDADEADPDSAPAPKEEPTPEPTPVPEPEKEPEQAPEVVEPSAESATEPASEDTPREYNASWSDSAFSSQTVNYVDELIIGVGASYAIDPERDILLTDMGKQIDNRVEVSYSTSNKKYLAVSASGLISGVKRGSAQVLATVHLPDGSQKQLRKNVKVVDSPEIEFAPNYAVVANGDRLDLGQYAKVPLLKASPNVDANVRYSLTLKEGAGTSEVTLDKQSGKLQVAYSEPGDVYVITARTYGGEKASFTIYLGQRAERVEILFNGEVMPDGRPYVVGGGRQALEAIAYAQDGTLAARQDFEWHLLSGDDVAGIGEGGLLSIADGLQEERTVTVGAYALDGGDASAELDIVAIP